MYIYDDVVSRKTMFAGETSRPQTSCEVLVMTSVATNWLRLHYMDQSDTPKVDRTLTDTTDLVVLSLKSTLTRLTIFLLQLVPNI